MDLNESEVKNSGEFTKTGLKRSMTMQQAVMFGVGGAVGSGILFAAAGGLVYAGPADIISWILTAIFIVLVTLPFAEYAAMFPRSGISARVAYYSYGSYGGFLSGWALLIWAATIPAIEAVAVSTYASHYFPFLYNSSAGVLTPSGIGLSIVLLLGFFLLNLVGIGTFSRFNQYLTWIKVLIVIAFIAILPLLIFHPGNFTSPSFAPSFGGIFIAIPASGILFSFGGYRQVADMAGEVENPAKNMPKIIGLVLLIQSLLYIGMAIVIIGSVNFAGLKTYTGNWAAVSSLGSPLVDIMSGNLSYVSPAVSSTLSIMIIVFFFFAIISPGGTLGVYLTGAGRILFGYSEEDAMPQSLKNTNKNGAPYWSLLIIVIMSIIFLLPLPSWYALVDFVVVAAVANFAVASLSLPVLRKMYPNLERPFKIPYATLWSFSAFIIATYLIYWATYPTTLYALVATLGGSIVFIYQANRKHFKGLNLKNSIWIPMYLIGMICLSYLGGTPTGGVNLIPYPDDYLVLFFYAIFFWVIGLASAPKEPVVSAEALLD
jgi:amino acid transporter